MHIAYWPVVDPLNDDHSPDRARGMKEPRNESSDSQSTGQTIGQCPEPGIDQPFEKQTEPGMQV